MKYTKAIAVLFTVIIICSSLLPAVTAQPNDRGIIERGLIWIFKNVLRTTFGTRFFVLRFTEPETWIADPNTINIEFLDQTTITVGVINESTGNYISLQDKRFEPWELIPTQDYEISLEIPDYLPDGAFIGHFSPQSIVPWYEEGELKTQLNIESNIPEDISLPENIQLRINITKYSTAANLYRPPSDRRGHLRSLIRSNFQHGGAGFSGLGILWTINAMTNLLGPPFGRIYSGKRTVDSISYVDIVVKLRRFHLIDIQPTQILEIGPDQLISIPLEIQNLGSHIDTFNFRIGNDTDNELIVSPPSAITLEPNEIGYTSIGVASPRILNDPGTARKIRIEAYSIYEPEKTFNNTAAVITRGYYVSEVGWYYGTLILPIILLGIAFYLYRQRRRTRKFIKKPDKPWTLPEEKKYLEKLKKRDKKEYESVRLMMEDEYKSALLWYKDYRKYLLKNSIKNSPGIKILLKKPKKKQKKKPEYNFAKLFEKSEKKVEKPKKPKAEPEIIDTKVEDQLKKEQALLRIKREQEKQKRKLKLA